MKTIHAASWEEAETIISNIEEKYKTAANPILFRGQTNSEWKLTTTLERRVGGECGILGYYKLLNIIKTKLDTFNTPDLTLVSFDEIQKITNDYNTFQQVLTWNKSQLSYEFLAYLRHNRFPSPLLDWTISPYVAAFFAFSGTIVSEHVSLFAYSETARKGKLRSSNSPQIYTLGPNIRTHHRHFRQQSNYTICVSWDSERDEGWKFVCHEHILDQDNDEQDLLWKIKIPFTERMKVLQKLDRYNLNAFSMYGDDEALLETLAFRELDTKQR